MDLHSAEIYCITSMKIFNFLTSPTSSHLEVLATTKINIFFFRDRVLYPYLIKRKDRRKARSRLQGFTSNLGLPAESERNKSNEQNKQQENMKRRRGGTSTTTAHHIMPTKRNASTQKPPAKGGWSRGDKEFTGRKLSIHLQSTR